LPQSSGKVKTGQLWSKNKADLAKQLGELKTELGQLRTQKIAGGSASKLTKMCVYSFGTFVDLELALGNCDRKDLSQKHANKFLRTATISESQSQRSLQSSMPTNARNSAFSTRTRNTYPSTSDLSRPAPFEDV